MPKWVKWIIGILLLPICASLAQALWLVLRASGAADEVWIALAAGAGCWVVIYRLLPKPMWVYVVGHELTHVIWTWLFGGRVRKFRASAKGGHVIVTKSNFLIALAPYFFPLYALVIALGFLVTRQIWGARLLAVWFHLLLGAAYAFHLTLTWHVLKSSQSDIAGQGYLFSAVVVFLGNLLVLLIGIPLLAEGASVSTAFVWWWQCTQALILRGMGWIQ